MQPYMEDNFFNPGGVYPGAVNVRRAVNDAHSIVGEVLGCQGREIFFTSGGTEADNWALKQFIHEKPAHIITSQIEHKAVLNTCKTLQQMGWKVTYLPVDKYGIVKPDDLQSALRVNTRLVSIMLANNEVGTVEPIKTLAAVAHAAGALFHTDAVQAVGHIPVNVNELGVDFLSLSAHKFGGPKGMGALYAKDGAISSFVDGGGQEMDRRSGTENVPGIIGTAAALMLANGLMSHNAQKARYLRDCIIDEISSMDGVLVTGPEPGPLRLPGLASFIIDGVDSETLVMDLSAKGVCVSAGSACSSGTGKPSYVLRAMGYSEREAWSSLRVSLDDHITPEEVSELIEAIKSSIKAIRNHR
jgi:cysteine desulfurase